MAPLKLFFSFFLSLLSVHGFVPPPLSLAPLVGSPAPPRLYAYIPSGLTPEEWAAQKKKDKKTQNLGGVGPRGFKSRSMQSFQEAMERGEAKHLMPMFNAKEKLRKGKIRKEDIPYMQRGGSWDNTDVKGARNQKKWLKSDKAYSAGGYKKEQSVSILGYGDGLDWTGGRAKRGPVAGEIPVARNKSMR